MVNSAILLAGGRGTRLFPLTNDLPKPLLPIDNIPTLSRILRQLEKTSIRRAILTVGYRGDTLVKRYGGLFRTLHLSYAREKEPLGTAGAVKAAATPQEETVAAFAYTDGQNGIDTGDLLVLSGDALFEGDLDALIESHYRNGNDVTLSARIAEDVRGYGVIVGQNGRIDGFLEKPDPATTPSHLINTGIYVLSRRILSEIPSGPYDFGRELFPALLQKGYRLGYRVFDDYWCDVGTPQSYLDANLRYSGGAAVVGINCRLSPSCEVIASVVMDNAVIGQNAVVRHSILGRGVTLSDGVVLSACVVEAGAVLKHSPPQGSLILADGSLHSDKSGLLLPLAQASAFS